ncbi:hypothetical protein [Phenylobacterium sp.]|uniref:hypothetical protein n=1 Tax=Phenylobacterium sp. TaxID=1871053 RepID=UPI002B77F828|nr:hypothetical protein [Phenylobacterium sp.]HLZ75596.1 hypothetical protein [Phenylobacterium sp.]
MTPFRNDQENPFARERAWPAMPQAPLRLARARTVLGLGIAAPDVGEAARRPQPPARRQRRRNRGRDRRLTPLIGAAAVGVGGLLTLFLLIGSGPPPA